MNDEQTIAAPRTPNVFLSYAFEDSALAEKIANALQARGIDTWWAGWCIQAGDSIRQRIDEGLGGCTHFIVLLTPASVTKPWVNAEMDAGFLLKMSRRARFIPLRCGLSASALPPLLQSLLSPEIDAAALDVSQLVNDVHCVTRKPVLGSAPTITDAKLIAATGYSPAASALAKLFVERTKSPFEIALQTKSLRSSKLPAAIWIMACETSSRCS